MQSASPSASDEEAPSCVMRRLLAVCVCVGGCGGDGGVLCSTLLHAPMLVPWGLSSKISIPYGEVTTADLCPNLRPPPL